MGIPIPQELGVGRLQDRVEGRQPGGARRSPRAAARDAFRGEIGGAPRNPAPRNHFLVWIVKSPGCHCTDALGGEECRKSAQPS